MPVTSLHCKSFYHVLKCGLVNECIRIEAFIFLKPKIGMMIQINTEKIFEPLTITERWLASQIVDIAISIHKMLGPGLLESVYEKCFCYELDKRGISYRRQQIVPLVYDNYVIDEALRLDVMVDDLIILEFKAEENNQPIWEAQLISYLKLTGKRLGYILNFHVRLMKDGIKRRIV
jgi:GxxExxY protein